MSKILCIIDGMTDPDFHAEDYPNLSSMCLLRHVDTTHGQDAESLGCILRLLGVKRIPTHLRGYAEALGNDIPVEKHDLILRGSWFALDEQGRCTIPVPAPATIPESNGCRYYSLGQYKSLLVFPGLADFVFHMVTYPPYACGGLKAQSLCPQGCGEVSRIFRTQLTKDQCLIPWGQSASAKMAPFPHRAAVVCGTSIVKGIARLLDMMLLPVSGVTGDVDTDLDAKTAAALSAAEQYPFVLLHINGADEAAHRKNAAQKTQFISKVDAQVVSRLLCSRHELTVVSDHGTDPETGLHTGMPQPLFIRR